MLALKQALSLVSTKVGGGAAWSPTDESSLEAWYENKVGITRNGSTVSEWADQSTNSRDMVQADATEQPAYNTVTGDLTFDSSNNTNLQTTSQMSFSADFTLGIKMFPTSTNGTFVADNTTANELFKISASDAITIKIDGSTSVISLDSGTFGDDYIVLTRASDVFTLYKNGVAQSNPQTLAGTIDIDAIGIRRTDVNGFDGTIQEVQIYSISNATLTANINARLSTL
tara:strand:+ start:512 stop:1195 length:684 start_codon:yes stop_codon:yes gene_type:complete